MSGRTRRRRRPRTLHPQLVAGRRPRPPGSRGRTERPDISFSDSRVPLNDGVHEPSINLRQLRLSVRTGALHRLQFSGHIGQSGFSFDELYLCRGGGFLSGHLVVRKFLKFGRDVVDLGNKFFTFLFDAAIAAWASSRAAVSPELHRYRL